MKRLLLSLIILLMVVISFAQADVWIKDVFDSTGTANGVNCAIALDENNHPHVSYSNLDNLFLYYAYYNGLNWEIESVDSFGIAGLHTSIALDSENRPHISYTAHGNNLRYVFWDGDFWNNSLIDSGLVNVTMQGFRTSIALDSDDHPHIAYINDTSGAIMYARYNGSSWHIEEVQDITESFYVKLLLYEDSIPYIGYHVLDSAIERDSLRIAYKESPDENWMFTDVVDDICPAGIFYQSFDMDSEGNCYFAYETAYSPFPGIYLPCNSMGTKKIAKYDGSSWSYESIPSPSADPFDIFPTFPLYLKIDNNNNPAFLADTILFWKKDGSNWEYYGLGNQMGDEVAVFQQMTFDEFGSPHMVFGQPWVAYYRLFPGSPQINVPVISYTYNENYATWNCLIQNLGEAPVIIDSLQFKNNNAFQLADNPSPLYIYGSQTDSISINFMPDDPITYYDTLLIYSNDSVTPVIEVTLEGTGSFDPATGDLLFVINDCYASPEYHAINYDILLEGVSVSLYQGGILAYGPFVSNVVGLALQGNILPGSYDIIFEKIRSMPRDDGKEYDTLLMYSSIVIDTGLIIDTVIFPESLMVQSYQWVYDNSHLEFDEMTYSYGAESHNPGNIRDMLDDWSRDLDQEKIESASRLILAQEMFAKLFAPERRLAVKGFEGITDMLHFVIKATEGEGGWLLKLFKLVKIIWDLYAGDKVAALMQLMQFLMEYIVLEIIDEIVDRIGDMLPCIEDPLSGGEFLCGDEIINAAWKDIKATYSIWDLPAWDSPDGPENSWNHVKGLVYDKAKAAFIQGVYINIYTNPLLEEAKEKSATFDYYASFPAASEESSDDILLIKVMADDLNDYAWHLLQTADLLNATILIVSAIGDFVPLPSWLETVKTACMYAAIGTAATATGIAFGGFFAVPENMDNSIDVIYNPYGKFNTPKNDLARYQTAAASYGLVSGLQAKIATAQEEYDSILTALQFQVNNQEIEAALFTTGDLALADVELMQTVQMSAAPAYSMAHTLYDTMPGFAGLYDGIITTYSDAAMTRFFTYMSLMQYPGDSSQAMKDYLSAHLDTVLINNQTWTSNVTELLDSMVGVDIPGIIVASKSSQSLYSLESNTDTAFIKVELQNVGAVTADSISIVLNVNDGLLSTSFADSIYVGSLAPGEISSEYTWSVVLYDTAQHQGVWSADISSSNAKTYSPDGSIGFVERVPTGIEDYNFDDLLPDRFALYQNYPNPFNMSTVLTFDLPKKSHVTLEIYNILGQKVQTVVNDTYPAGRHRFIWDGKDNQNNEVASGIYLYKFVTDEFVESKKMILLK